MADQRRDIVTLTLLALAIALPAQNATPEFDPLGDVCALDALGSRKHLGDLGVDYAWSTAATIDPWPEGAEFFPRIFDDPNLILPGWRLTIPALDDTGTEQPPPTPADDGPARQAPPPSDGRDADQPPSELPAEVEQELVRSDEDQWRWTGRVAGIAYLSL